MTLENLPSQNERLVSSPTIFQGKLAVKLRAGDRIFFLGEKIAWKPKPKQFDEVWEGSVVEVEALREAVFFQLSKENPRIFLSQMAQLSQNDMLKLIFLIVGAQSLSLWLQISIKLVFIFFGISFCCDCLSFLS